MKQLLIVNSAKALNANTGTSVTAYDFSHLDKGAISFFEVGGSSLLSAAPTKNFGIALGRGADRVPFIIPEVDINTLTITKALPKPGVAFTKKFTFPTPVVGKEYTLIFVKKDTVRHERFTWTVTIQAGSTTAATEATALKKAIEAKLGDKFTVSVATAAVTITAKTVGEQWEILFADSLTGTSWTTADCADAEPAVGDKAYVQDLASQCAGGKGFFYTEESGRELYPNYPEAVEDLTPNTSGSNGVSTAGYEIITLKFMVGRDASKTRDEKVWQLVHIALPVNNDSYATINAILPEGDFSANASAAIAAEVVTDMVKSTSLNE